MRIEHFALNVPDPRAMAEWYVSHLGMRVVRSGPGPKHGRFLADDGGLLIELYDDPADPHFDLAATGPATFHLAIIVNDMDGERERLVAAGATPLGAVNTTPKGDRLAFLRDPFGLTLQLAMRIE